MAVSAVSAAGGGAGPEGEHRVIVVQFGAGEVFCCLAEESGQAGAQVAVPGDGDLAGPGGEQVAQPGRGVSPPVGVAADRSDPAKAGDGEQQGASWTQRLAAVGQSCGGGGGGGPG